ncbi:MAG: hypothetical protein M3Z64_02485 [Verrucomicrobiota bacterium]|nr:hypothetical protein [Verrucomicrobiota bacterium]
MSFVRGHSRVVAAGLCLLFLLLPFWPSFESGGGFMDEGTLLVYPELVRHGVLPYRDFETFYGPANPFLLAGVYSLFGPRLEVERAVGLLYRVLALAALFALASRYGNALGVAAVLLAALPLLSTALVAYAWLGGMAAALWGFFLATSSPASPRKIFFAGILASLAILFRLDLAPAVFLGSLPSLISFPRKGKTQFIAGAAIGLLPLVVLCTVVGWHELYNNLFFFPVVRSSAGRHLPFLSVAKNLYPLFFLHLAALFTCLAVGVFRWRSDRARIVPLLSIALFGLGVTHQAYQRLDEFHLFMVVFVSLAALPITLAFILSGLGRTFAPAAIACAVTLTAVAAPFLFRSSFFWLRVALSGQPRGIAFVEQNGRSFPVGSLALARTLGALLDALDRRSHLGERLFVGPADLRRTNYGDTFIYYLMMPKLIPASYFLEMNPLSANRPGSRLASDLRTADWLILDRTWDETTEPNRSQDYGSDQPNNVVREEFEQVRATGPYLLLHRRQ